MEKDCIENVNDYIVVDVETTGLNPAYHQLIEIAAIKVKNFEIIDTFKTLINPGIPIPNKITQITSITTEMVGDSPQINEVLDEFSIFCGDLPLIGHNLLFDFSFLKQNCANKGIWFEKCGIDTLKLARRLLADLESKSLSFLCEALNIEQKIHHRAYDDAFATNELYKYLYKHFINDNELLFSPQELLYKPVKICPITTKQKIYLNNLIRHHKIDFNYDIGLLSKNEASRMIDKIILCHGRIF